MDVAAGRCQQGRREDGEFLEEILGISGLQDKVLQA
jgi:hypothetical protein